MLTVLNPAPDESLELAEQIEELRQEQTVLMGAIAKINAELSDIKDSIIHILRDEIIDDRKRITAIESIFELESEPTPKQHDQAEMLRAYLLAANGWVSGKEVRKKMGLNEVRFSQLLKVCHTFIEVKINPKNRREKILKCKY